MSMLLEQFDIIFDTPESVTRLQEFILDMAVKGKLVSQDSNDEPTIELLSKIKIEKEILIRDKKIKKEKLISSIIDEKTPYELPKGWEWVRLNDIVELDDNSIRRGPFGSAIKKDMFVPKGINTFKVYEQKNAIKKDCFIGDYYISQEKYNELKRFAVRSGDIIISCAGTIGETYLLPKEALPGIMNQALLKIRINNNVMLNRFFLLVFKALTQKKINETAKGSAMKNMTSVEYLKKEVLFGLPPLNEQKRIVEKVDQLMNFCEALKKGLKKKQRKKDGLNVSALYSLEQSTTYEELRESLQFVLNNLSSLCTDIKHVQQIRNVILSLAVKGKLVAQDEGDEPVNLLLENVKEEKAKLIKEKKIKKPKPLSIITEAEKLHEIPDGWKWVRLGDLVEGFKYGTSKKSDYQMANTPILRIPNIVNGLIDTRDLKYTDLTEEEKDSYSLEPGDLLMIRSNGSESIVGKSAVVVQDLSGFGYAGYLIRIRPFKQYVCSKYLFYVLKSSYIRKRIEIPIRTTTGVKNINTNEISNLIIPLPSFNEQKRIVEKVDQLMTICDELEKQIKSTNDQQECLLQSILYQAFQQQDMEVIKA